MLIASAASAYMDDAGWVTGGCVVLGRAWGGLERIIKEAKDKM
jgi:hypothetical protein